MAALCAAPVAAQSPDDEAPPLEDDLDALSEDARRALEEALERLGPILQSMIGMIDGLLIYETPRVLPNGDILIPRRRDAPADAPEPPERLDL
ncbi:MAG: hypothetical protein AAGI51_05090 [Pseudomonadota bacterium]